LIDQRERIARSVSIMPEKPTEPNSPIDVHAIHQLVRLMKRYDVTSIDLIEGPRKIRLRRRGAEVPMVIAAPAAAPAATLAAPAPAPAVAAPTQAGAAPPSREVVIESPMVGTYYASSTPDAPPFVAVGTAVRPDTTVCIIEAMKVFTDIPAGVSGTVTEILVKNGQPVEFGQPLFRVNPA
jgi:acetyl-CoA carboxylase biotin carboxyl carrier protein